MAKRPTLADLTSQYGAQSVINTNNANIKAAFDNTLSRDGSSPNQMGADIDLNSNSLLNVSQTHTSSLFVGGQLFLPSTATTLLTWLGAWTTATSYDPYDVVSRNGSSYLCLVAHTSDNFTTDLSAGNWVLLAQAGAAGAGSGDLLATNNLSDVDNAAASLSNLGGQPFSATLTTLSSATAAGLALMDDADAAAQRATLGLGTFAVENTADYVVAQATWEAGVATTEGTITPAKLAAAIAALESPGIGLELVAWGAVSAGSALLFGSGVTTANAGTGRTTLTFTTPQADTDYAILAVGDSGHCYVDNRTTTTFQIQGTSTSGDSNQSHTNYFLVVRAA